MFPFDPTFDPTFQGDQKGTLGRKGLKYAKRLVILSQYKVQKHPVEVVYN